MLLRTLAVGGTAEAALSSSGVGILQATIIRSRSDSNLFGPRSEELGWVGVPGTQLRSLDAIEDGMAYDQRSKSDWGLEQIRLSVQN